MTMTIRTAFALVLILIACLLYVGNIKGIDDALKLMAVPCEPLVTMDEPTIDITRKKKTNEQETLQERVLPPETQSLAQPAEGSHPPKNFQVNPLYQKEYNLIAATDHSVRCERYGYVYDESIPPRRLFFGAMVADDSLRVFDIHATEAYDLYHVVALSESNTTHMNTPRRIRFEQGSPEYQYINSGIFGQDTTIIVDYWLSNGDRQKYMEREALQRTTILDIWKRAGMGWRDVGIMGDLDEVFTRDFLIAAIHCDIPIFREGQDCRTPRIMPTSISFESSPLCIKRAPWFHPNMVVGECLEGIGDPSGRVVPVRRHKRLYGRRADGYGEKGTQDYNEQIVASGRYPLFNGVDMRNTYNTNDGWTNWKVKEGRGLNRAYGVAFHFHNWFQNFDVLRNKYKTYAHGDAKAHKKTLSELEHDLDVMVRCAKNLPQTSNPDGRTRFEMPYDKTVGPKPIFFLNVTYRKERHELVQRLVIEDEAKYGTKYNESKR